MKQVFPSIWQEGTLSFVKIHVFPESSKNYICRQKSGKIHAYIKAKPRGNAANEQLLIFLSSLFSVPVSALRIIQGHTSPKKIIVINGLDAALISHILQ